jgi:hypothetical protein
MVKKEICKKMNKGIQKFDNFGHYVNLNFDQNG